MVFDKYTTIKADKFVIGQDKDKLWFCKDFRADTIAEAKQTISALNKIFNEANKDIVNSKNRSDNIDKTIKATKKSKE